MSKLWKATMPRTAPAPGKSHVVLSVKGEGRTELVGELDNAQASVLMLIAMMKTEKVQTIREVLEREGLL